MDLRYQLNSIEQQQDNDIAKQVENARQLQLARLRLLYSRVYNTNSLRLNAVPYEYIVLLNYIFEQDEQRKMSELAELDHIIYNDVIRHSITDFQLNNI